ncbi:hypothetical protein [Arthrobacter sp. BE255]|uniref:hypothetical protein n=1 Tax=Arthrobacter sp. BE255 TaxID=2817721 RepID=UPI002856A065|nr:hypothetical protein [Arthrobacter sp. BE255]MDR7161772.1 hypothetical protein [Arthrobacter sp. BE255]
MRITEHYKITGPVPFVDVQIERDNLLFTHPTAIRNDLGSILAPSAMARIESFTAEVLRCRASPHAADRAKGLKMLQSGLNEPNETRLGYTQYGSKGHGWGPGLGDYLWNALNSPLCRDGLLTGLDQLPMFIPRVGQDLISDMTTRLVFPELIDYTMHVVAQHPAMARDLRKASFTVWDPSTTTWTVIQDVLPFAGGRQLLLVPKAWVSNKLLMAARPYYNRFTTGSVQQERLRYLDGKPDMPLKRDLQKEFPDVRGLNTSQTLKAANNGTNLIQLYTEFVDEHYEALDAPNLLLKTAG